MSFGVNDLDRSGSGGLVSGLCVAAKGVDPHIRMFAMEPARNPWRPLPPSYSNGETEHGRDSPFGRFQAVIVPKKTADRIETAFYAVIRLRDRCGGGLTSSASYIM